MKTLFYKLIPLIIITCIIVGCQKSETSKKDGELVNVTLAFKGDFNVDVDQDPLTKASTNDIYGINVFYDAEGDGTADDVYAYGLFDNVADMSITMLSNHIYKLTCTLIKDGKNKLFYGQAFDNAYSGYAYPFQTNSSGSTLLNNKFIIGSGTYFTGFSSGDAHLISETNPSSGNPTPNASVNRFYGEFDNYVPVPNGTIEISLKRVIFGTKFVVTGVKEGLLRVKCGEFYDQTLSADNAGVEQIYTFSDVYTCWEKGSVQNGTMFRNHSLD